MVKNISNLIKSNFKYYRTNVHINCIGGLDGDSLQARGSGVRISVQERFNIPAQNGAKAHPASCTMGTEFVSQALSGLFMPLTTQPHVASKLKKGNSYTSTLLLCLHGML
jgi:hypothetical protein